jgi:hypothetical protein
MRVVRRRGCRGFYGPVPLPLLMSGMKLCAKGSAGRAWAERLTNSNRFADDDAAGDWLLS